MDFYTEENLRELKATLEEEGYTGDIVIEHEMAGRADRNADLKDAKIYLENIISQI